MDSIPNATCMQGTEGTSNNNSRLAVAVVVYSLKIGSNILSFAFSPKL